MHARFIFLFGERMKRRRLKFTPSPALLMLGGALFILSLFFVFSFLLALITFGMKDPVGLTGLSSTVALALSGAVGGAVISRLADERGALLSVLASLIFSAVFIILGAVIPSGRVSIATASSLSLLTVASALGAFLLRPRKRRRH